MYNRKEEFGLYDILVGFVRCVTLICMIIVSKKLVINDFQLFESKML